MCPDFPQILAMAICDNELLSGGLVMRRAVLTVLKATRMPPPTSRMGPSVRVWHWRCGV
jgi:hypothetical protein